MACKAVKCLKFPSSSFCRQLSAQVKCVPESRANPYYYLNRYLNRYLTHIPTMEKMSPLFISVVLVLVSLSFFNSSMLFVQVEHFLLLTKKNALR